jgi:mannose-6-phosphate isomerase-like protein (cupin superfamily)
MAGLIAKHLDSPDETRSIPKGKVEIVQLGDVAIGRAVFEPGWRWSECVKPIVKSESCQTHHTTYIVSGRMHVRMDDGTEQELGPGDAAIIPPGHDAWIVGDEPCVGLDFTGMGDYAKPR